MITRMYLEDMTDEEMLHRPDAGCNHIKWQLGHLIGSDNQMVNGCFPGTLPELPALFSERYTKETAGSDDASGFGTKAELLGLFAQQRAALHTKLKTLSESDLNSPAPEAMQSYAPTSGAALAMIGLHWTMHTGQWAVIRRQLGRAPIF
jgi:hypothetical protein